MQLVDDYAQKYLDGYVEAQSDFHTPARAAVLKALERLEADNVSNMSTCKGIIIGLETELAEEKAKVKNVTIALVEFLEAPEITKIVPGIYARTLRKTL